MAGLTREQRAAKAEALLAAQGGAEVGAESVAAVPTIDPSARLSVITRRLMNPFGSPSREIPLRGDKRGWVVRTFVADPEHPNRHFDAVHRLGWVPLVAADIAVSVESIGYVVAPDGRIVRGLHGAEVLMAMPAEEFARVQQAKSDANIRAMRKDQTKAEVAQAAAKEHGSEAGDAIHEHFDQREILEPV